MVQMYLVKNNNGDIFSVYKNAHDAVKAVTYLNHKENLTESSCKFYYWTEIDQEVEIPDDLEFYTKYKFSASIYGTCGKGWELDNSYTVCSEVKSYCTPLEIFDYRSDNPLSSKKKLKLLFVLMIISKKDVFSLWLKRFLKSIPTFIVAKEPQVHILVLSLEILYGSMV